MPSFGSSPPQSFSRQTCLLQEIESLRSSSQVKKKKTIPNDSINQWYVFLFVPRQCRQVVVIRKSISNLLYSTATSNLNYPKLHNSFLLLFCLSEIDNAKTLSLISRSLQKWRPEVVLQETTASTTFVIAVSLFFNLTEGSLHHHTHKGTPSCN